MTSRLTWLTVRIAAGVALVVVPFGYAVTGVETDVLIGAGCGLAVAVGVGLRGGSSSGPWTGILVGSIVGITAVLIAGAVPLDGWGVLILPILALAVGLIDGFSGSSLSGYRDVVRETFILSVLIALGLLPATIALLGRVSLGGLPILIVSLMPIVCVPMVALVAGMLSRRREGWRDARPPWLLLLGALALLVVGTLLTADELRISGISQIGVILIVVFVATLALVVLPAAAFLLGRTAIVWLQPRLRVYGHLADYLRVMWVPIGGFAVGYLTIILLFSGFYGMLEHFRPGAFSSASAGIADWFSFAFFTALGQDFTTVAPVSVSARMLVGAHLILSAGWALVLFAAVMSSIGPKLDRIARHHAEEDED
ncbi:MAG: hypothetical protein OXR82_16910 [Gammaproteobacteria bacterium]|nr:hypothetical protein [Gammaproteobacteria bacterium]